MVWTRKPVTKCAEPVSLIAGVTYAAHEFKKFQKEQELLILKLEILREKTRDPDLLMAIDADIKKLRGEDGPNTFRDFWRWITCGLDLGHMAKMWSV